MSIISSEDDNLFVDLTDNMTLRDRMNAHHLTNSDDEDESGYERDEESTFVTFFSDSDSKMRITTIKEEGEEYDADDEEQMDDESDSDLKEGYEDSTLGGVDNTTTFGGGGTATTTTTKARILPRSRQSESSISCLTGTTVSRARVSHLRRPSESSISCLTYPTTGRARVLPPSRPSESSISCLTAEEEDDDEFVFANPNLTCETRIHDVFVDSSLVSLANTQDAVAAEDIIGRDENFDMEIEQAMDGGSVSRNGSEDTAAITELIQILRRKDSDLSKLPEPVRRRLKDFRFAQRQRLKKYSIKPFGIVGLFCNLSDIRADLRWAQDAAWRREHGRRYVSWSDYEAQRASPGLIRPYFTYSITAICVVMMAYAFYLNDWKIEELKINPLFGPSPQTLLKIGALQTSLVVDNGEWWRLLCPIVLHAGLVHLFLNMAVVYPVGRAVERNHGTAVAFLLFSLPALGGNILSAVMQPGFVLVGASGGIFGLIGVCVADIALNWKLIFLVLEQHHGTSYFRWICCLFWLIFDLIVNSLIGFTPFVDNFAHLGGLVYGFLMALSFLERLPLAFFGRGMDICHMVRIGFMRFAGISVAAFLGTVSLALLWQSDGVLSACWDCRYISCAPFPFWTEDKWWECDGCDAVSGDAYVHPDGEYFGELDLNCPDGGFVQLDILDDRLGSTDELLKHLPSYCRSFC